MSNLIKAQQAFIDRLLESLDKNIIPWKATWDQSILKSYNGVSQKEYKGINLLNLYIAALNKGYDDPRWMTFKQANENGYRIKRHEEGTHVFFYSLKNIKTGKLVDQLEYDNMTAEERVDIRIVTKSYTVFNAKQIDGIPALNKEEKEVIFQNEKAQEFLSTFSKNANLVIKHQGHEAFYSPTKDMVTVPSVDKFIDERSYYATVFHECAHATMHPTRLNRDAVGTFGTEKYAKEELRAELTSAFLAMDTGFRLEPMHEENHQAYIQHWKKIIKDEPKFIFQAIKDAQKIREYLLEKGDYEKIYMKEDRGINKNMLKINESNFPDPIFRKYISENFDKDQDGILSNHELNQVTEIEVGYGYTNVKSLKGIEFFSNLKSLYCAWTPLITLDVSNNINLEFLNCENTQITSLDVSNNTKLEGLNCNCTEITNLDVAKNPKLEYLNCIYTKLTSLDISKNAALKILKCDNTPIIDLNLNKNPRLEYLKCYNTKLTSLDVTKNIKLKRLDCENTQITSLDLSNNTKLEWLDCSHTKLTSLDLSNNTKLELLFCFNTKIKELDLSNNPNLELKKDDHVMVVGEKKELSIQNKIKEAKEVVENKTSNSKEVKVKEQER